jgi:hypothetical protein
MLMKQEKTKTHPFIQWQVGEKFSASMR